MRGQLRRPARGGAASYRAASRRIREVIWVRATLAGEGGVGTVGDQVDTPPRQPVGDLADRRCCVGDRGRRIDFLCTRALPGTATGRPTAGGSST
jgi:hypothetical protein